jgi:PIN domain nuclease of toxin-antitoxin system
MISTVNLAEVQGKLLNWGWLAEDAWADASGSVGEMSLSPPIMRRLQAA